MQFRSFFTLAICFIVVANVDQVLARKRSEAFRRCLKYMKTSFRACLIKLTDLHERDRAAVNGTVNGTASDMNGTANALVLRDNDASGEERDEIMRDLQATLVDKLDKVPPGKLKIDLMTRLRKEFAKTMAILPMSTNDTERADTAARIRDSLVQKVNDEINQLKRQERMYDPKQRRKILEEIEAEKLLVEMNKMRDSLAGEMQNRSRWQFPEHILNRIFGDLANSTTLKSDLTAAAVDLVESRDILEEIKRTARECKRIYELDVSATVDLANYLLQNVDVQIDLHTAVVRLLNRQPGLVAGTFKYDFTRAPLDPALVQKASTEIYEMTASFAEMRQLHYKIKDRDWSRLANKTSALFGRINAELLKQNQQFLIAV